MTAPADPGPRATAGEAAAVPDPFARPDLDLDLDVPPPPPLPRTTVVGALRPSFVDLYYGMVRFVAANLLWGVGLIVLGWLAVAGGAWLAIVLAPLLGLPMVGIYRLAALTTRSEEVVLSDVRAAMREKLLPAVIVTAGLACAVLLLATNIVIGLGSGTPLGWGFATVAGWALVAVLSVAVVIWPLLGDPTRRDLPLAATARLAGFVVLAAPVRIVVLGLAILAFALASTILFAAVVTISVAYVALVSCRVVLPEADRLAERFAAREIG